MDRGAVGWSWERCSRTFFWCGNAIPHLFALGYLKTLKHGCDLTYVLVTRRFALLVKSLQWNRNIQCGKLCKQMHILFKEFGEVFLVGSSHTSFFSTTPLIMYLAFSTRSPPSSSFAVPFFCFLYSCNCAPGIFQYIFFPVGFTSLVVIST